MAYTQADIDKLEAAMVALNAGEMVEEVRYGDGSLTGFAVPTEVGIQAAIDYVKRQIRNQTTPIQRRSFLVSHGSKGL